jgi:DNA-directed RNA polymerase subunit RPC12/RpoP
MRALKKISKTLPLLPKKFMWNALIAIKKAIVSVEQGAYTVPYDSHSKTKFKCANCFNPIDDNSWYGPIVIEAANANCGFCGSKLKSSKTVNKFQDTIEVKCLHCNQEKNTR